MCFMAIWMPSLETHPFRSLRFFYWIDRGFFCFVLFCFAALSWAAWAVCMLGDEFVILNICCKHLFSHSESCLFLSFRLPLQCKSFLGDEMPFKSFAVVVIILSIDSKRTCFDSCQSVFAYIFLKRIRAIFRPFNSSSYLDFFFCKQLGRDINSFPFPLFKEAPPCPSWLLTAYIASIIVGDFPCLHILSAILLVNLRR